MTKLRNLHIGLIISVFILVLFFGLFYTKLYIDKSRQNQKDTCPKCNILLIDIDILRADALPCYGYFRNTAPNICAFAKKSLMFTDNYSVSRWTLPDMFSTITSLYPTFHGQTTTFANKLSTDIPTLAETLRNNGYRTVLVVDPYPSTLNQSNGGFRGYDQIESIQNQPIENIISKLSEKSEPWFVHYIRQDLHMPYLIPEDAKPIEDLTPPSGFPITNTDFARLFNIYLKNHYSEVFKIETIAQYESILLSPHKPNDISVTTLFYELGRKNNHQNFLKNNLDSFLPAFYTYMGSFNANNESEVAYVRIMYDTLIRLLDNGFSKLFQNLNSSNLSGNTITVIMSNHGEEFGEHGNFHHILSNYHSELYHTPLIVHAPNFMGKKVNQSTSNMDIFPTIMELIDITKPNGLQGLSLLPAIYDEKISLDRFVVGESGEGVILQNRNWLYFLPDEAPGIDGSILHNKIDDPTESYNVATKYPELTRYLYGQARLLHPYGKTISSRGTVDNSLFFRPYFMQTK